MVKVLVVDDEKGICEFVSDFLKRRGHKVLIATSGKEALSLVEKESPALVLLDVMMPNMNGLAVLEKIKTNYKDTKVVMVTVADDKTTYDKALKLGADGYVRKPFTTQHLESIVMANIQDTFKK